METCGYCGNPVTLPCCENCSDSMEEQITQLKAAINEIWVINGRQFKAGGCYNGVIDHICERVLKPEQGGEGE